ncbi:phage tail protein [Fusobacterium polymorphum]|uniref:phage tail-collar fiber domain-containing protein n=1 Tax=Fusobacterium nucleatum subsp. polymorphum TaxID=76857 RepID=UPI0032519338
MKFSGLTKKGRLYLAKIQAAEEPIQFTKIKFGDGKLSEHENPADLVDIKNIKVEKSILNKEQKEDAVILTTIIDNVGLVEGYFPRETGIYVQDEDQEVLYFYMNDGDETSWLPPEVDGPHKMEMKINLISSNTGSVLIHNDGKDLYITKDYLESNYTQKGNFNGTAQDIEDRVVAAVGKEDGKFPLTESVAGNIYYFPGNKKFYYCLKSQTSRVSVPNADFEELSIYQNHKKLENLNSFDVLYQKTDDFGNWKDLTINLTKAANDSKYSHYIIYTGQGNQLTNSLVVQSLTNVEFFFDTYQVSNISRVGTAYAKFLNATTIKLTMLEGVASGDGIVKILAFKKFN